MDAMYRLMEWYRKPSEITETTHAMAQQVLSEYPWFTPARLLSFGYQQQEAGQLHFPPYQSFAYNPVRYYEKREEIYQDSASRLAPEAETWQSALAATYQEAIAEDYFAQEGIAVAADWPAPQELQEPTTAEQEEAKDLMVMMSFSDWLAHFQSKKEAEQAEAASKQALKIHLQKEKLAAAMEAENEEIPDQVFEMAMNSIQNEEELLSEAYAEVLAKQGKYKKAIEMYGKLSLKNPDKSGFFAAKIEKIRHLIA